MQLDKDEQLIRTSVNNYFMGTYHGDKEQLEMAFHPAAHIVGSMDGKIYDWTLNEFIARVTMAPTASIKKEIYNKKIIFIDRTNDVAIVKARVVAGGLVFTDYITVLKMEGRWMIRHKSFVA